MFRTGFESYKKRYTGWNGQIKVGNDRILTGNVQEDFKYDCRRCADMLRNVGSDGIEKTPKFSIIWAYPCGNKTQRKKLKKEYADEILRQKKATENTSKKAKTDRDEDSSVP